jgi:hypothetical protein
MFTTQPQHKDSKQPFNTYLKSRNCQGCAVDAMLYRYGLLIAALRTPQETWPKIQGNVHCVACYLDPLSTETL